MVTSTERPSGRVENGQTEAGSDCGEPVSLSFADALQRIGYQFDHEDHIAGDRIEVWVNRKAGQCVLIEWFSVPEAER